MGKFFSGIIYLLFALAAIWALFWVSNFIVWLSSLGIETLFTDIATKDSNILIKTVVYLLGFEWLYPGAFLLVLVKTLSISSSTYRDGLLYFLILTVLLTALVIIIYDPRCVEALPAFLSVPVQFLQNHCFFYLLGGITLADIDFSGTISDPYYFTLFDIMIVITCLGWNFFTAVGTWDDLANN